MLGAPAKHFTSLALGYGADGIIAPSARSRDPGGLNISQLITLYITPLIYLVLQSFQERVLDKVPFLRSAHMHHEADAEKPGLGPKQPAPVGAG